MKTKLISAALAAFVLASIGGAANAQTIGTGNVPGFRYGTLGSVAVDAFGQSFTAVGVTLTDFTFYGLRGTGDVRFVVATFPDQFTVPTVLYQSDDIALPANGRLDFSGLNIATTLNNSYSAYLTTSGVTDATSNGSFTLTGDTYAEGSFLTKLRRSSVFQIGRNDTAFNATFSPAVATSLPEPTTWGMMLLGFGTVGFGLRRRAVRSRRALPSPELRLLA